ncbi:MAG: PH domain-containing protein [Myxococcota bacterium]
MAKLDVARQGWRLTDRALIVRRGVFTRRTTVVPVAKLQSVSLDQGPVQRWFGLGVVTARVAASRVDVPALGWAEAERLQQALVARSSAGSSAGAHPEDPVYGGIAEIQGG